MSNSATVDSSQNKDTTNKHSHGLTFWITLIRGILAFALGISLFFIPAKTGPMLANFMGLFWITTGLVSLRHDPVIPHRKLARAAAIIVIIAGVAMFTRKMTNQWVAWEHIVNMIGVVIILTGILHIFGGVQIGRQRGLGRTGLSVALGIFEIVLGVLFLFSESGRTPLTYRMATIWALVGGTMIIVDAIYQRYQAKHQPAEPVPADNAAGLKR